MERDTQVIELGVASDETKGPTGKFVVDETLMRNVAGLSDDPETQAAQGVKFKVTAAGEWRWV